MAAPEPAADREPCTVHPDRPSVGACESCARPSCLGCAVPFRGRLLCRSCASRELGSPAPPEPARPRRSRFPEVAAAALLGLGLLASIPPWHRSGRLTSVLSAWRLGPEPWPLVACVGLVAALAAAMGPVLLGAIPRRTVAAAYAILAGLSGGATVITLASAPDYFSPTPAPFAALGAATVASAVGFARVRALPRGT